MPSIKEALISNCFYYQDGLNKCKITESCGDILLEWPSGKVTRSWRGAFGDFYIPLEDGRNIKIDLRKLLGVA